MQEESSVPDDANCSTPSSPPSLSPVTRAKAMSTRTSSPLHMNLLRSSTDARKLNSIVSPTTGVPSLSLGFAKAVAAAANDDDKPTAMVTDPHRRARSLSVTLKLSGFNDVDDSIDADVPCFLTPRIRSSATGGFSLGAPTKGNEPPSSPLPVRRRALSMAALSTEHLLQRLKHPVTGVPVKDRRWKLRRVKDCFVASQLVDWLMKNLGGTREENGARADRLLKKGHMMNAHNGKTGAKATFADVFDFYQWTESPAVPRPRRSRTLSKSKKPPRTKDVVPQVSSVVYEMPRLVAEYGPTLRVERGSAVAAVEATDEVPEDVMGPRCGDSLRVLSVAEGDSLWVLVDGPEPPPDSDVTTICYHVPTHKWGVLPRHAYMLHTSSPSVSTYDDFLLYIMEHERLVAGLSGGISRTCLEWLTQQLVSVLSVSGSASFVLWNALLKHEVAITSEKATLFRNNTITPKLLSMFGQRLCGDYLIHLCQPLYRDVMASCGFGKRAKSVFELDPMKLGPKGKRGANAKRLEQVCDSFLNLIISSVDECPMHIRLLCKLLRDRIVERFPKSGHSSVGGYLFLRLICPAIVSPQCPGFIIGAEVRRGLVLVSKVMQNMASGTMFGKKEAWMEPLNPFLERRSADLKDFFDTLCDVNVTAADELFEGPGDLDIQVMCSLHQAFLHGLVDMHDSLCKTAAKEATADGDTKGSGDDEDDGDDGDDDHKSEDTGAVDADESAWLPDYETFVEMLSCMFSPHDMQLRAEAAEAYTSPRSDGEGRLY